jgi:hypothetical protein
VARLLTVLRAVARAAGRESNSLLSFLGNNLFYAGLAFLAGGDKGAFAFFLALMALVLFLPSSGDPMTVAPRERLNLWPLTASERYGLRLLSPLLNPAAWLVLAAILWKGVPWLVGAFIAAFFAAGFIGSSFRMPNVWVPRIPAGALTELVRKDLRQSLTALDFYCALLVALPALYFRVTGKLPAEARLPLTALVVIIMSTIPLTLFGLDGESGMARYFLWPIPGWAVVSAKGIAYLLLVLLVTAPLSPAAGLAGGLLALAVGQFASVRHANPQSPWRLRACSARGYNGAKAFVYSVVEMIMAVSGCVVVARAGALWLVACAAFYAGSLWFCGRYWDGRAEFA